MATIVIGIGNLVRKDDSVGIHAVRAVAQAIEGRRGVTARELPIGGMRLMEAMVGYDRAILIDAIQTEGGTPGAIYHVPAAELLRSRHAHSLHDASLAVALEMGRIAGLSLPRDITAWAVEAADVDGFGEGLTPEVGKAVPEVVRQVMRQLEPAITRSTPG
jgi:hydrogenase maturation protease